MFGVTERRFCCQMAPTIFTLLDHVADPKADLCKAMLA